MAQDQPSCNRPSYCVDVPDVDRPRPCSSPSSKVGAHGLESPFERESEPTETCHLPPVQPLLVALSVSPHCKLEVYLLASHLDASHRLRRTSIDARLQAILLLRSGVRGLAILPGDAQVVGRGGDGSIGDSRARPGSKSRWTRKLLLRRWKIRHVSEPGTKARVQSDKCKNAGKWRP